MRRKLQKEKAMDDKGNVDIDALVKQFGTADDERTSSNHFQKFIGLFTKLSNSIANFKPEQVFTMILRKVAVKSTKALREFWDFVLQQNFPFSSSIKYWLYANRMNNIIPLCSPGYKVHFMRNKQDSNRSRSSQQHENIQSLLPRRCKRGCIDG